MSALSFDAQEEVVGSDYTSDSDTSLSIPKLLSPLSSAQSDSGYESVASPSSPFDLSGSWPALSDSEDAVEAILPSIPDDVQDIQDMDSTITQLFPDLF